MSALYTFFSKRQYKNPYIVKDKVGGLIFAIFRFFFILGMSYLFLFPLFYMIITAFKSPESVYDPSVIWLPKSFSLQSITEMVDVLKYWDSMKLTFFISVLSTLGTMLSCSIVAYGLARFDFKMKYLIFGFVVLTIIVPPSTTMLSSYLDFQRFNFGGLLAFTGMELNLLNTPWVFVLPSVFASGLRAGLFIFIFRQFFLGMPKDLEEAAFIDGCGTFMTFVRIIVPLAIPAFITVMLFSFIWHWNDYYSSLMYFTDEVRPITPMLSGLQQMLRDMATKGGNPNMSAYQLRTYMAAGSFLTVLPPLIIYLFAQRYFTESVERTGIVG